MKFKFSSFLSGFLAAGILFSVSALAISSRMTIEVDPINVQVNGEVFQPTDVNGKEVPVFAYQGTTYAPLRALAEAYGLEVGYNAAANMATVTDPDVKTPDTTTPDTTAKTDYSDWSAEDEAAYQEFKTLCSGIEQHEGYWLCPMYSITNMLDVLDEADQRGFIDRLSSELSIESGVDLVFIDGVGHHKSY